MSEEYRSRVDGGVQRSGDNTKPPASRGLPDRFTIGELAREAGVTLRALRFYQSKGLLPQRVGGAGIFTRADKDSLDLILHGKRLGFTLTEIRDMLAARAHGCTERLPISRRKCIDQIAMLERQRQDIDRALAELRQIYAELFISPDTPRAAGMSGPT
ncbi:MAG TPA: MerR family transcriptional regulator [Pseudolabrys sp.]|nr:MerR family transcriptional regulator [Pseudolabrys sp.]